MNGKRWSDNKTWWIERKKAFTTIDNIKDRVHVINTETQFATISFPLALDFVNMRAGLKFEVVNSRAHYSHCKVMTLFKVVKYYKLVMADE